MIFSTAFAVTAEHAEEVGAFYTDAHFWVNVAFLLVFALAYRPVMRAISAALDARAAKIRARLDEAHTLREDAQEMLAAYQRKQNEAAKEAEAIIAHARAEAQRLAEQAAMDLEESLKRREQMALERIAQAEAAAVREVQDHAVDVAVAAARQVLSQSITADQAVKLVDSAIHDLPRLLH
ncbi:MAG: F0F1 ATP synthase subunit B [Magnetospirillum sp.]|nr:F0F1 ATP synthase subunit B [Magnetospirillum sp.]